MGDEGLRQPLGIFCEVRGEFVQFAKGCSIDEFTAGIDLRAEAVVDFPVGASFFWRGFSLVRRSIACAQSADGVEGFESKSSGIDFRVAAGATGVVAVFVELFANGGRPARVGINCSRAGRRRGWRFVEESVHDPDAAFHGGGGGAVCGEFVNGSLSENTAPGRIRSEGDLASFGSAHVGDSVVFGEALVEHGESRTQERGDGGIGYDEFAHKDAGFGEHAFVEEKVVFGVEFGVGSGFLSAA